MFDNNINGLLQLCHNKSSLLFVLKNEDKVIENGWYKTIMTN